MKIRTNAYSVLCVLIRTFAIWVVARSIIDFPAFFNGVNSWGDGKVWTYFLVNYSLPIAVAFVFWIYADKLAKLALARPQQAVFDSDTPASEWQALAFSVVGLWQTVAAIISLCFRGVQIVYMHSADSSMQTVWDSKFTGSLVASCVQLLLGLGLLFGARGLVGLIRRYRQIGHTHLDTIEASGSGDSNVAKSGPKPPV